MDEGPTPRPTDPTAPPSGSSVAPPQAPETTWRPRTLEAPRRRPPLWSLTVSLLLVAAFVAVFAAPFALLRVVFGPAAGSRVVPVAADSGPRPAPYESFRPSSAEAAYFMAIAFAHRRDDRIFRWARGPMVHVAIVGPRSAGDEAIVRAIVSTIDGTIPAPYFVYLAQDDRPEIRVSIVDADTFARKGKSADTVGYCDSFYQHGSDAYVRARIVIEDTPELRPDRSAILWHEFGHALGLGDSRDDSYTSTIMFYRLVDGGPRSFTTFDLAAVRMLYDPRMHAGDTRARVARLWGAPVTAQ